MMYCIYMKVRQTIDVLVVIDDVLIESRSGLQHDLAPKRRGTDHMHWSTTNSTHLWKQWRQQQR